MMKKHITWQEVSDLSVALQNEIISLLKENNLDELELKIDDERPEDATYVLDYNGHFDSWTEKMVTHVGLSDDDLYLKVYDNIEGEESTIYASEMSLATRNPCWLVSIRDNMLTALEADRTDKEYAELNERLNQAEQDILQFMLELLKKIWPMVLLYTVVLLTFRERRNRMTTTSQSRPLCMDATIRRESS